MSIYMTEPRRNPVCQPMRLTDRARTRTIRNSALSTKQGSTQQGSKHSAGQPYGCSSGSRGARPGLPVPMGAPS